MLWILSEFNGDTGIQCSKAGNCLKKRTHREGSGVAGGNHTKSTSSKSQKAEKKINHFVIQNY